MFLRRCCTSSMAVKMPWMQTLVRALGQLFGHGLRGFFCAPKAAKGKA